MRKRGNTLLHTPTTCDTHESWEKRYPGGGREKAPDTELGGGDCGGQVVSGDGGGTDLTHISLFAGIGGFDLAAGWAGFRTIAMCEIDPFCQEVLAARFGAVVANPDSAGLSHRDEQHRRCEASGGAGERGTCGCDSQAEARFGAVADAASLRCETGDEREPRRAAQEGRLQESSTGNRPLLIPDIRDFDGTRFRGATLLTGGFPCQPFSHAGKRGGTTDSRHLWPEMFRVIQEARPTWIIGENVAGIRSLEVAADAVDLEGGPDDKAGGDSEYSVVLDSICEQLEGIGYEVQPIIIPACSVGAPHRRDRVWIVAYSRDRSRGAGRLQIPGEDTKEVGQGSSGYVGSADSDAPDAELHGRQDGPRHAQGGAPAEGREVRRGRPGDNNWDIPWIEVAQRFCQLDDGVPSRLVGYLGTTEAHIKVRDKNRVQKLKALGNAICWPVAYEIIRCIAEIENGNKTR